MICSIGEESSIKRYHFCTLKLLWYVEDNKRNVVPRGIITSIARHTAFAGTIGCVNQEKDVN